MKAPYREVQNGFPIDHAGEYVFFRNGFFETEDASQIEKLIKHKIFSQAKNLPGVFWEYVEPVDEKLVLIKKQQEEIAALQLQLAERAASTPDDESSAKAPKGKTKKAVEPKVEEPASLPPEPAPIVS